MPRNGSGVYNLPAGNPVAPNTTIQSSWANTTLSDIAAALTASLTKDGQTVPTANLPMGSFKHTGVANATARNQYAAAGQVQDGAFNWGGTAGGTADAITLSPAPGITAYAAGQTFWFIPSAANTGAVTVAVSGLAAKAITKNGTTALSAGDLSNTRIYQITYDGTRFQLASDPLGTYAPLASPAFTGVPTAPTAAAGTNTNQIATMAAVQTAVAGALTKAPVRQTVLSGPVDANGLPDFGGTTGGTTVTTTGTLRVTAANGFDAEGAVDRIGAITNAAWTGLSTNGTMYLYLDIASDGTCTTGSGTLAPVYQWGGSYSVASGQFTFNIQEMVGKVGDGAAANQTYRLYVGEVSVAGNVVTGITWYALMGRYYSGLTATLPSANTRTTKSHNVGTNLLSVESIILECTTNDAGFVVGERLVLPATSPTGGSTEIPIQISYDRKDMKFATADSQAFVVINPSTGTSATLTAARWSYAVMAKRIF